MTVDGRSGSEPPPPWTGAPDVPPPGPAAGPAYGGPAAEFATPGVAGSTHPGYHAFDQSTEAGVDGVGVGHPFTVPVLGGGAPAPGYRPGRPGPPVWLGLLVMLLGPAFALVMMGRAAVSHLDLDNTGSHANHNAVALREDTTYMVGTESGKPGRSACRVRTRSGDAVKVSESDPQTVHWPTGSFVIRSSFYLDEPGLYRIDCPQAGPSLLVIPVKGSLMSFSWALGRWMLVGALFFVTGIVMVILRRRKPRYAPGH